MSTPTDPSDEVQASTPPPTPAGQETPSRPKSRRPWYGSNLLIIIYCAILLVIFCIVGFIPYSETFITAVQNMFQRPGLPSILAATPSVVGSPTSPAAATEPTCVIVWVEHQPDDLGKKSRATVWEQKVSEQVKATGMTPREFYKLVVEHNPQLIQDDYEFKKGKTYFLPECQ